MRWLNFLFLQCLIVAVAGGIVYGHRDKVSIFKTPPASLAKWYKPENKRQVWLHNMFKLRRELQAIEHYAGEHYAGTTNDEQMQKWLSRFAEHYQSIGEMVPEWRRKLDMDALSSLQRGAQSLQTEEMTQAIAALQESCDSCHRDYRVVTALLYRAPDFSQVALSASESLDAHMEKLVSEINQIKIASEDGLSQQALTAFSELKKDLNVLGESCSNCHDKGQISYPTDEINHTMLRLGDALTGGTVKEQGKELGMLAVQACARCHGTHRLAFDTKELFNLDRGWLELIQH